MAGSDRGQRARKPWQIPARGWISVFGRVRKEMGRDHIGLVAAGCAFYALLALFPAIGAGVSIWGLVADPDQIVQQIDGFTSTMPSEAAEIIHAQAADAASEDTGAAVGAIIGILLAVFSASKGVKSLTEGMNIAYDEDDQRGFMRQTLVNITLTITAIVGIVMGCLLVIALPAALGSLGLPAYANVLAVVVQWLVLIGGAFFGFGVLYRFGPAREDARWEWASGGALVAVILWIAGSALFTVYVANFASYNATYGAMGAVVILLMWLYLTAFATLLGAEVNCELERQTRRDTTTGPAQPIGERGAHAADTVAEPAG